jgi:opacity protein-like surface antigen
MRSRLLLSFALAMIVASACDCPAQTIYTARERTVPFAVGAGMSNFDIDYGQYRGKERRMEGITLWLDYTPPNLPGFLRGLDLEIEGRDINYALPSNMSRMRQSTAAGGALYSWRRYRVVPYAKYLLGMGSLDFPKIGAYSHDTRAISAPGAGLELRAFRNITLRADYEYQFWPHLFGPNALNPNGFTISSAYDFRLRPRSTY